MTEQQKRGLIVSAAGLGAILLAQAWRRRTDFDFARKSVVVTGGSRGLGLLIARELADRGARLTMVARSEDELGRAVEDIRARQPFAEILPAQADVRRRYEAERAIAQALDRFGRIDVLINNAGIIQVGPVDHMKLADYEDAMNTHFWGPLFTIVATLIAHRFWAYPEAQRAMQQTQFMKNLAIMGGFLFLFVAGAGAWSVDRRGK